MIYRNNIYFSIGTRIDLRDNIEIGLKVLNMIFDFCKDNITTPLMLCYDDNKGYKKPKFSLKSVDTFKEKYLNKQIGLLTIMDYFTKEQFFGEQSFEEYEDYEVNKEIFECNIDFGIPNRFHERGPVQSCCDIISMSVAKRYLFETNNFENLLKLFKEICFTVNGIGSFFTGGSDMYHSAGLFDRQYYHTPWSFSRFWDEQVRGYFWLMFLTDKQVDALDGIEKIENQGFYSVEKTDNGVFIQCTENIIDYTIDDALKLRAFLKPLFPPFKKKAGKFFPNREYMEEKMKKGLYLFDEKDML